LQLSAVWTSCSQGHIETQVRSLSKFPEQALLIILGDIAADAQKIGSVLILERKWKEIGIQTPLI
jgi:hypothetical protein